MKHFHLVAVAQSLRNAADRLDDAAEQHSLDASNKVASGVVFLVSRDLQDLAQFLRTETLEGAE